MVKIQRSGKLQSILLQFRFGGKTAHTLKAGGVRKIAGGRGKLSWVQTTNHFDPKEPQNVCDVCHKCDTKQQRVVSKN